MPGQLETGGEKKGIDQGLEEQGAVDPAYYASVFFKLSDAVVEAVNRRLILPQPPETDSKQDHGNDSTTEGTENAEES